MADSDLLRALARVVSENQLLKVGERVLVLRATPLPNELLEFGKPECQQSWKIDYDALQAQGYKLVADPKGPYDTVIYLGTRQKEENLYNFARALALLRPDGRFIVALQNSVGAKRHERSLASVAPHIESTSKYHSRIFWTSSRDLDQATLTQWLALGEYQKLPSTPLLTCPGVFCARDIDKGSAVLLAHLPKNLSGHGIDYGSGCGVLTWAALQNNPAITGMQLIEAEHLAFEASRKVLPSLFPNTPLGFHWFDIRQGVATLPGCRNLDFALMNPPFHENRNERISLGRRFIADCATTLRKGGRLIIVANSPLPYEVTLREHFTRWDRLAQEKGFKVLEAIK